MRTRYEQAIVDVAIEALKQNEGVKSEAAKWLGVAPRTLYNWMEKWPEVRAHHISTCVETSRKNKELRELYLPKHYRED